MVPAFMLSLLGRQRQLLGERFQEQRFHSYYIRFLNVSWDGSSSHGFRFAS